MFFDDEQPQASYPEMELPVGFDTSTLCRGCFGIGDSMCNYHRTKLDHAFARQMKIESARQALEALHKRWEA